MTHLFDIDGTLVTFHTNTWLLGAKETLLKLYANGDRLIFITARGEHDNGQEWSPANTRQTILKELDDLGVEYVAIFGVPSPRILHDDSPIYLDQRVTNQTYTT